MIITEIIRPLHFNYYNYFLISVLADRLPLQILVINFIALYFIDQPTQTQGQLAEVLHVFQDLKIQSADDYEQ